MCLERQYRLVDRLIPIELKEDLEDERIRSYQDGGNALRRMLDNNAALALRAIQEIATNRTLPPQRKAYIVHSLKRPEEVEQFRAVYGEGFFLVAVVAPKWLRITALAERIAEKRKTTDTGAWLAVAEELVQRDEDEQSPYGQKLTDTFPTADLFISLDDGTAAAIRKRVEPAAKQTLWSSMKRVAAANAARFTSPDSCHLEALARADTSNCFRSSFKAHGRNAKMRLAIDSRGDLRNGSRCTLRHIWRESN